MAAKTVDVSNTQVHLSELLSLVRAGTEIILTDGDKPLARLLPFSVQTPARVAGLHPGAITISDDFDEPLPDEFWTGNS